MSSTVKEDDNPSPKKKPKHFKTALPAGRRLTVLTRTYQIKNTGARGRGVFTGKQTEIPVNTVIAVEDKTKLLSLAAYETSALKGYGAKIITYDSIGTRSVQMVVPDVSHPTDIKTISMLCNSAAGSGESNNATYRRVFGTNHFELTSTAFIGKDKEILVDYGEEFEAELIEQSVEEKAAKEAQKQRELKRREKFATNQWILCTRVVNGIPCEGAYLRTVGPVKHRMHECPSLASEDDDADGAEADSQDSDQKKGSAVTTDIYAAEETAAAATASGAPALESVVDYALQKAWKDTEVDELRLADETMAVKVVDKECVSTGYGEPTAGTMRKLLHSLSAGANEPDVRFVDLGSGRGKVVLAAGVLYPKSLKESVGVEIMTKRLETSIAKLDALRGDAKAATVVDRLKGVKFEGGDICQFDLTRFTDVFVFGAVFTDKMLTLLRQKLEDPKAQWKRVALCVRQRRQPPILMVVDACGAKRGVQPEKPAIRVRLSKQKQSFSFYIYRR